MANYTGFSTIDRVKNFKLTDKELVKRDFLNLLHIKQGEMPNRPEVGTTIWNFVFEPNTEDTIRKIKNEIMRLAELDKRLTFEDINIEYKQHSVIVEIGTRIYPDVNLEVLILEFDERSNTVSYSS